MDNDYIRIHIETEQSVELCQFTSTLNAINDSYNTFAKSKGGPTANLYVKELSKGSLIVYLSDTALGITPDLLSSLDDYVPYLGSLIDSLKTPEESKISVREAQQLVNMCQIPKADSHARIEIATIRGDGNVVINGPLVINNSVAVESGIAANMLSGWDEQSESVMTRKLLYFDQMNNRNSKSWNKGMIDDISPNALYVVFSSDEILKDIMISSDNPFIKGHIVDVAVMTVKGEPKVYKVTAYHESVDIE